jgi:hypothetical protein
MQVTVDGDGMKRDGVVDRWWNLKEQAGGGDGIAALRRDEEGGAHDWSLALARSQPKAKQCDRARTWIPGVPHVTD